MSAASEATLAIAAGYHRAWTTKSLDEAGRYLAPDLEVEVPMNSYANADEFRRALAGFAPLVASVRLVSQLADGDEAMLLYDMVVEPIGALRVAEHFTVSAGRIARIRQVHDTAPLRAAGFDADLRLVKEYLTAFCAGDFKTVATLLADDFSFTGPLRQVDGRDAFLAGAEGLIPIMRGHRLLRQWQDGREVCSVYELHIESPVGSGSVPMSEWDTVADGRIVTARLLYDTAAFLALAPSPAEA